VEFLADPDGDLAPGAVLITSELLLPVSPELAVGSRTKRIATVYTSSRSGARETQSVVVDAPVRTPAAPPPPPPVPVSGTAPAAAAAVSVATPGTAVAAQLRDASGTAAAPILQRALARVSYEDDAGAHEYAVIKASVSIGRGGLTYPVDIRIVSSPDVSREHARIRHDAEAGRFCLIDLSTLGTTVNGEPVPRGFDAVDGSKRENGVEVVLPDRARIGLANAVFLDFRVER
jgi:hypothetical protein